VFCAGNEKKPAIHNERQVLSSLIKN
jgi:hypothetical protein